MDKELEAALEWADKQEYYENGINLGPLLANALRESQAEIAKMRSEDEKKEGDAVRAYRKLLDQLENQHKRIAELMDALAKIQIESVDTIHARSIARDALQASSGAGDK